MTTHKIKKGECLSMIAEKYGLDIKVLEQLNSDQIKDINLIYEGNELKLPDEIVNPIELEIDTRTQLPAAPTECANLQTTCSVDNVDYIDILYIPAHPKTGKKMWLAITEQTQQAIMAEKATLADVYVKDDKIATLQKLSDLSILSKFTRKPHDQFLTKTQSDRYHDLLLAKIVLQSQAEDFYQHGADDFVKTLAEQEGINLDAWYRYEKYWHILNETIRNSFTPGVGTYNNAVLFYDYVTDTEKVPSKKKILMGLHAELIEHLDDEIVKSEKLAEKIAKNHKSDDGTYFVYDENCRYFTSTKQVDINEWVNKWHQARYKTDVEVAIDDVEDNQKYLKDVWDDALKEGASGKNIHFSKDGEIRDKRYLFAHALMMINRLGYVTKEQCLTEAELIGTEATHWGPECLNKQYPDWRKSDTFWGTGAKPKALDFVNSDDDENIVNQMFKELGGGQNFSNDHAKNKITVESLLNEQGFADWSFYTCLALIKVIDKTFHTLQTELASVLGTKYSQQGVEKNNADNAPKFLHKLIWVKQVTLARIEILKQQAHTRAKQANLNYMMLKQAEQLPRYSLLWDETPYKPKEKRLGKLINQAGEHDLQVVECSLLSEGEVFWIRGPAWYMSTDLVTNLGHVKDITQKFEAELIKSTSESPGTSPQKVLTDTLTSLAKVESELFNLSKTVAKFDSIFWQDNYHWQGGIGPNGQSAYVVNAGAQFMRFTSESSGMLNQSTNLVDNFATKVGVGGEIKGQLSILSAQMDFEVWLPFVAHNINATKRKVKGYALSIPYEMTEADSNKTQVKKYDAGNICVNLKGKVYGMAGASCQLSTNVAFGPADTGNELGIRGSSIAIADYNQQPNQQAKARLVGATSEIKGAAEAKAAIDVFAGVEAGGVLSSSVYWQTPQVTLAQNEQEAKQGDTQEGSQKGQAPISKNDNPITDLLLLGSLSGEFSASYGAGFGAEFRVTFQAGFIVIVTAARAVLGPGCSGKVGIKLHHTNADRFIGCLLGILQQSGFKRLAIFGDVDKNGVNQDFMMLNDLLLVAVSLGLTLGEVLLFPLVSLSEYKKEVLSEKYAPFLARRITDTEKEQVMKAWVTTMPPETLGNLFLCLIQEQSVDVTTDYALNYAKSIYSNDARDELKKASDLVLADNQLQMNAILLMMGWIAPSSDKDPLAAQKCRQFEKTLMKMGTDIETIPGATQQWQIFTENWLKLRDFVNKFDNEEDEFFKIFDKHSKFLCRNMTRFHYIQYQRITVGMAKQERYISYYAAKDAENQEIPLTKDEHITARNNLKLIIERVNAKQVNWSHNDQ
ncbi:LysM peptidoglycan-binding domain-containing protein [Shewanella marina]|uniref:LysM peptidoglycan-binding domain-containing protein n=1 Tax=Shewanella marina TaxID=487319 RepID=UPI00047051F6|nr:LysM domain-containing protein [Shewanella marina]